MVSLPLVGLKRAQDGEYYGSAQACWRNALQEGIPAILSKATFLACLIVAPVRSSEASIPCPVSFLDGKSDADGISLSFRNKGKLPIQQLAFTCVLAAHKTRPSSCHEETGLFFPGNSYDLTFLPPKTSDRSVQVALRSARLSDGAVWHANRDQPCRPLRLDQPKTSKHR